MAGERVYVTDVDSAVWALDSNNGESMWKNDLMRARALTAPVPVGEYLMVADFDGYIHILAQDNGELVARHRIGESRILASPRISDGTLFIQTEFGSLAAIKIKPYAN